ncbi:MAG TPA: hypothetical protein VGX78_18110, partial [Pirellulales bacterium]|nr:hypothetical protein [Pirellulales bacterium]
MRQCRFTLTVLTIIASMSALAEVVGGAEGVQISVTLDAQAAEESAGKPITGRLYVFTSRREGREPRFGPDWFSPEPFFGLEVNDFAPGEACTLDDAADGFPGPLSTLPQGTYRVQAMLDQDFNTCHAALGVGNLYSDVVSWELDPSSPAPLELKLVH